MTGESIFKITEDIAALEHIMERVEDEEEEVGRMARFELDGFLTHIGPKSEIEILLAEKVDGYVSFYRHLEARKKARREEAAHLSELARQDEGKMKRLKEAVKFVSQRLERPKLEGNTRSITISTSKRPAIKITDEETVPQEFKVLVPETWLAVKTKIASHIQETGEIPPGVETRKVVSVRFK